MQSIAPAKINLFLAVGGARADGYHAVTTVLHTLELADEVTVTGGSGIALECDTDLGVPPESNLAYRAAEALGAAVGREPAVLIRLSKRIPHGAGLGGGSSDAAGVLAALATEWGLAVDDPRVIKVAARLGADVPFFLAGSPCALMTGRGDALSRRFAGFPGRAVVIVKPPEPVSTAAAYAAFDAAPAAPGDVQCMIDALERGDEGALIEALANNLEQASCAVVPSVGDALRWVRGADGVSGALVAGSGSAVVGLCEDDAAAIKVASAAVGRGWWSVATRLARNAVRVEG